MRQPGVQLFEENPDHIRETKSTVTVTMYKKSRRATPDTKNHRKKHSCDWAKKYEERYSHLTQ